MKTKLFKHKTDPCVGTNSRHQDTSPDLGPLMSTNCYSDIHQPNDLTAFLTLSNSTVHIQFRSIKLETLFLLSRNRSVNKWQLILISLHQVTRGHLVAYVCDPIHRGSRFNQGKKYTNTRWSCYVGNWKKVPCVQLSFEI